MTRIRSPNYPQISLPEAITRVALIFSKEHQHPAPKEVIVKDMGYNGLHGNSLGALSALSKYGLLERDGQDYRVTARAIAIIHPEDDASKAQALREAAQAPTLFAEIFEHFKGRLPSDENLKAYLIRQGFAESALTAAITSLRDTMTLVVDAPDGGPTAVPVSTVVSPVTGASSFQGRVPVASIAPPPQEVPTQEFQPKIRVTLTDHGLEVIAMIVDQKGIDRLVAVVGANRDLLPEVVSNAPKAEPSTPVAVDAAIPNGE